MDADDLDLAARAREVMHEAGFRPEFSSAALAQASAAAPPEAVAGSDSEIADQRGLLWSSIDNPSSRDLDQLEWADQIVPGKIRLRVAIADVDALAPAGSAIDAHAATNTTSVYTGLTTFPMIPERLSTDLTSLHEDTDRLAVVVEMEVQEDGSVSGARVRRALVRNHARLDYGEVGAWLATQGSAQGHVPRKLAGNEPLVQQLRLQQQATSWLRARRRREGALEFETTEVHAVAEGGRITGLEQTQRNAARDLVEDIMLASNGAIAGLCESAGASWIRRAVRSPARWERIVAVAQSVGYQLPTVASSAALSKFLQVRRVVDPDGFPQLSLAVVKLIGKGEYLLERKGEDLEGHFGLAMGDYTHGTAPNRRYADLVTQRLLKAALSGASAPYSDDELHAIATRCTEREDEARRVERKLRKIAAAVWLLPRVGEYFDGVVTGAASKGTFVRLVTPPVEGRMVRGEAGWDVGDRVRVRLVAADPRQGHIDFASAGGPKQ
jgi:exoribonuclease-2